MWITVAGFGGLLSTFGWSIWLAQQAPSESLLEKVIVNYGVFGVLFLFVSYAFIRGIVRPGSDVLVLREENKQLQANDQARNDKMIADVVPALTRVTDALTNLAARQLQESQDQERRRAIHDALHGKDGA